MKNHPNTTLHNDHFASDKSKLTGETCNADIVGPGVAGDGKELSPIEERSMADRPGLLC